MFDLAEDRNGQKYIRIEPAITDGKVFGELDKFTGKIVLEWLQSALEKL